MGKDLYSAATAFYTKRYATKNPGKANFNHSHKNTWIRPNVQSSTAPRVFNRSKENALAYDYKQK